jgi:hypothetical protein
MTKLPDIDIDLADRWPVLEIIRHVKASHIIDDRRRSHNSGIYLQNIPHDLNGVSSITFKDAEDRGYFKFDLLNNSAYKIFQSKQELTEFSEQEPNWDMLLDDTIIEQLPHVHAHGDILKKKQPRSVEQLAAVLAIIRPGKRYLLDKPWPEIMQEVWVKVDGQYMFKKSHAVAYAVLIVAVLNKLRHSTN